MRYDAKHKERTRERVLSEAARVLRTEGPERLGVAEVMSRVGLTHGGFYAHFRSKDDLVVAAMEFAFSDAQRMLEQALEGRKPQEVLGTFLASYLSLAHRDCPERGCPLAALSADLPRISDQARALYATGARRLTKRLQRLLEACGLGDAELLASSVLAELVGSLSIARAVPDASEAERLLGRSRMALASRLDLELPA